MHILLIISGGIAAYKSLELIRLCRQAGHRITPILTDGGAKFITPLSVSSLSESPVYTDLWSLKDEQDMGHIRLSREADLILIAPASANMMAKMAHGLADDLASTTLLASNKPIAIAPAMNPMMWQNPATQDNLAILRRRGVHVIGPDHGDMACGETGPGRMAAPHDILDNITQYYETSAAAHSQHSAHSNMNDRPGRSSLSGRHAIVTSGPTYEPIDPVRFIGNRSSGKQGQAIATALAQSGIKVSLISGPVALPRPTHPNITTYYVQTALEMADQVEKCLPADLAICAAAIADWRPAQISTQKIKKTANGDTNDAISLLKNIQMVENPDILAHLSSHPTHRPNIVIGFAAETDDIIHHGQDKLIRKKCDAILINQVGAEDKNGTGFGQDNNDITLMYKNDQDMVQNIHWPVDSKDALAQKLIDFIDQHMPFKQNN